MRAISHHGSVRIGISGWRYPHWRGRFYPQGLVQRRELAHAAERLDTVEINGSFYSLQRPESYTRWRDETPPGFVFAVKGSRYITHMKKLADIEVPLANFFASGVLALREKLGPILWQLPPQLRFDRVRFDAFFARLPTDTAEAAVLASGDDARVAGRSWLEVDAVRPVRHALEVRHPSLLSDEALALYRQHRIALVCADSAGHWPFSDVLTTDFAYARLHGAEKLYWSEYRPSDLDEWEARIRGWDARDVFVYFDNDAAGHAPFDAMRLRDRFPTDTS